MAIFFKGKKSLILLLLTLLFTSCFGLILLDFNILKYLFTLILFYFAITSRKYKTYKKVLYLYTFFVFCSCLYSHFYNHQDLIKVVGHTYPYWGLLFVFIVMWFQPTANQLEKTIRIVSVIFCCCYIVQWLIYPVALFTGSLNDTNITNFVFRMRMPGSICAYCLLFYSVNQYIIHRNPKSLAYAILAFLPIIIMGFRSLIAASVLFIIIMIPYITRSITKSIVWFGIGCIFALCISQTKIVQTKIDEMMERQNAGATFDNEDYIRFLALNYFENVFFTKSGEHFIGGGVPADKNTAYYKDMNYSVERFHYYWVDLGVVGLSYIIGIPSVVLLLYIVLSCVWRARSFELQYIRFTLLTVTIGSIFTSMEIFRPGNFIIISLFLAQVYIYNKEKAI